MALIQVSRLHVIFSMLIVGGICFGVYLLIEVSPIHTLSYSFLSAWNTPWGTGKIRSLCSSRTDIWIRWLCFFKIFSLTLKVMDSDTFVGVITWGCFSIQSFKLLRIFQKNIIISLWSYQWINPGDVLFKHEALILITMNSIIYCTPWTWK